MMFIGDDGKIDGNHEVTIDVQMDGEEKKHMVIITKITSENKEEIAKKNPAVKSKLNKKELSIDKLKFTSSWPLTFSSDAKFL